MKLTIEQIKEWYEDDTKPDIIMTTDVNYLGDTPYLSHIPNDQKAIDKIGIDNFKGYGDCASLFWLEEWPAWNEGQTIDVVDVQDNDGDGMKCILEAEDGTYVWCYIDITDSEYIEECINRSVNTEAIENLSSEKLNWLLDALSGIKG